MNTKKRISINKFLLLLAVPFLFIVSSAFAVDASYYSSLNGKKDSELRSALTVLLYNHHIYYDKYDGSTSGTENWDFPFDYDPNTGYVWDIYTTGCNAPANIGSSGSCCCTGLNREHLVCQSTFGGSDNKDKVPEYADRHSLFLTDAYTNQRRNDQAFGEVDKTKTTSKGGCAACEEKAMGMLGTVGTFADLYESTEDIYEPGDEYKGDIARAILYMVVRYAERQYNRLPDGARYKNSKTGVGDVVRSELTTASAHEVTTWKNKGNSTAATVGQMFSTDLSVNYGLSAYGKAILLKWHRQDPVSQKEIDRNDGVEAVQGNRNPFIDYPYLAEYLWGDKAETNFNTEDVVGSFENSFVVGESSGAKTDVSTPTIYVTPSTVAMGKLAVNGSTSQTITVSGVNLTQAISIEKTGNSYFTISANSVSMSEASSGKTITITYHPTAAGDHTATLTLSSSGATSRTVTISGSSAAFYTATWMANGSQFHQNATAEGTSPDLPNDTPAGCTSGDKVFVGWTTQSGYNNASTAPNDLFPTANQTGAPALTTNTTFYAVYAQASGTTSYGKTYTFSITPADFTTGTYASNNTEKTSTATTTEGDELDVKWTSNQAQKYSGNIRIQKTNGYIYNSTDLGTITDITVTSSAGGYNIYYGTSEQPTSGDKGSGKGYFKIQENGTATGIISEIAITFQKSVSTAAYINYNTLCEGCTSKTTPSPSFASASLSKTLSQEVSNALDKDGSDGAVTYTSSQTGVATVNATTGEVTIVGIGSTTITASLAATTCYNAASATYTLTVTDDPQYTVTFLNNGATYATRSGKEGDAISVVADPEACDGYTFEGWSLNQYAVNNTGAPSLQTPTSIPGSNTTYYAVYSKTEAGGEPQLTNNYAKITSTDDLTSGNYLMVANNSGSYYALENTIKLNYYMSATSVTPSNGVISSPDASLIWQTTVSGSTVTFYNEAASKYLYVYNNNTYYNLLVDSNPSNKGFTASVSSGEWTFTSASYTTRKIIYNSTYTEFAMGTSSTIPIYLYKQQTETGSTTYHTTSPDCGECTRTITATSSDEAKGTAAVALP